MSDVIAELPHLRYGLPSFSSPSSFQIVLREPDRAHVIIENVVPSIAVLYLAFERAFSVFFFLTLSERVRHSGGAGSTLYRRFSVG